MAIDIVPMAEPRVAGFHACLDSVARERKFLALVEALPLDHLRETIHENVRTMRRNSWPSMEAR